MAPRSASSMPGGGRGGYCRARSSPRPRRRRLSGPLGDSAVKTEEASEPALRDAGAVRGTVTSPNHGDFPARRGELPTPPRKIVAPQRFFIIYSGKLSPGRQVSGLVPETLRYPGRPAPGRTPESHHPGTDPAPGGKARPHRPCMILLPISGALGIGEQ